VAKVTERLAVSKQRSYTLRVERFSLKKLKFRAKISIMLRFSNWFTALEDFDNEVDFSRVRETEGI
jgi:hypothetical protein